MLGALAEFRGSFSVFLKYFSGLRFFIALYDPPLDSKETCGILPIFNGLFYTSSHPGQGSLVLASNFMFISCKSVNFQLILKIVKSK